MEPDVHCSKLNELLLSLTDKPEHQTAVSEVTRVDETEDVTAV